MQLQKILAHRLIRLLQYVIPAVVLALLVVLARNYRSAQEPQQAVEPAPKLSEELEALTEGFTSLRSEGGRPAFSIQARTNLGFKDDSNLLEDVEVIIYGDADGAPERRIRSQMCSYDQPSGDIRFSGDVEIVFDSLTMGRTAELTYTHQKRTMSSVEPTTIRHADTLFGTARRFSYSFREDVLRLDGGLAVATHDGHTLRSGSATVDRRSGRVAVGGGVRLQSSTGWIGSREGRADLEPGLFRPRRISIRGHATAEWGRQPERSKLRSENIEVSLSPAGEIDRVLAVGAVQFERSLSGKAESMTGSRMEAHLDRRGAVETLEIEGDARMVLGPDQLLESHRIRQEASGVLATSGRSLLQFADSRIEGRDFIIQLGDVVVFRTASRAKLEHGKRESLADWTEARFDRNNNQLLDLVQRGDFQFKEGAREGFAERARVEESRGVVTLDGGPRIFDSGTRLEADQVVFDQNDGSFIATGRVSTVRTTDSAPVLITAGRAEGSGPRIVYRGDAGLWRGGLHVRADQLEASTLTGQLTGEGQVFSIVEGMRAWSAALDYDERKEIIHYSGEVRLETEDVRIEAADVLAHVADGQVRQVIAHGSVVLDRGDVRGKGDRAVYDREHDLLTLTGSGAEVTGPRIGLLRGQELKLKVSDNGFEVAGGAETRAVSRRRIPR